jgi:protein-S-isoprenylcysteine O-methyltransferase Ste14
MAATDNNPAWYIKIPPPVWTIAMLVAAYGSQRTFPWASMIYVRSSAAAIALIVAGMGLAILAERTFAAAGTELKPASLSNKTLVVRGPFRATRNPMYLGLTLASLGIALYAGTIPFLLVPVLVFLLCNFIFVPFEEAKMQRQFGDQYKDYIRHVRRWL